HHLSHGDTQARSHIDLARIDRDRAVGMNSKEAVHFAWVHRLYRIRILRWCRLKEVGPKGEAHDDDAAGSKKFSSFHHDLPMLFQPVTRRSGFGCMCHTGTDSARGLALLARRSDLASAPEAPSRSRSFRSCSSRIAQP